MAFLESPKDYADLVPKLSRITFITTLGFFILLRFFDLVPYIKINSELIPPLKDYKETVEWVISFGIIPIAAAVFAWFLSAFFEMHNKMAQLLRLRYLWDKHFIVKTLANRVGSDLVLGKRNVKKIMSDLFYPEVKKIDPHFVRIFWRYAFLFWISFEHMVITFLTALILTIFYRSNNILWLWLWFLIVLIITASQLAFVTGQKSKDEANHIPIETVRSFFSEL